MRRFSPLFLAATALAFLAVSSCTLLLDCSSEQCKADGDCQSVKPGAVCRANLCVTLSDAGGASDAESDALVGQDGCFRGTPTTALELLNACTPSQCLPVDNCARFGLCDGGTPSLLDPDGGGAAPASDAGSPGTVLCSDPGLRPNVVRFTGSTNFEPFLKAVAPVLAASTPPYTMVWQVSTSCGGVGAIFNPDSSKRLIKEGPGKLTVYYDERGEKVPCLLDPAGEVVDIGESDIFADSCAAKLGFTPNPDGIGEYFGPIQAMVFAVPAASTQRVISAEGARLAFGRGSAEPWTDFAQLYVRNDGTGTNQILSRAIDVTPAKWWGVDKRSARNMADQLKVAPAGLVEKTIGTISTDFADQERGNITVLAFQSKGQNCGFWPDSTPFARDKKNVRDGHYPVWGPLHFFTRLEGGSPTTPAGAFVLRFAQPKLEEALVKAIADTNNVPACAMRVTRSGEMGPLKPFQPAFGCECFYESLKIGSSSCKTCTSAGECPATRPACNYGFCEER